MHFLIIWKIWSASLSCLEQETKIYCGTWKEFCVRSSDLSWHYIIRWKRRRERDGKERGMDRTGRLALWQPGPLVRIWKEATLAVYIFCSRTVTLFLPNIKGKGKGQTYLGKDRTCVTLKVFGNNSPLCGVVSSCSTSVTLFSDRAHQCRRRHYSIDLSSSLAFLGSISSFKYL